MYIRCCLAWYGLCWCDKIGTILCN